MTNQEWLEELRYGIIAQDRALRHERRVLEHWRPRFGKPSGLGWMHARHGQRPHAGKHFVRHPVDLYHVVDFVETTGLALYDEEPKRISRLFDETIADFSIRIGCPWACGKCHQRGFKPPSKPRER